MADTISTPAGPFPKKGVIVVGAVTLGILGYAYWRHRSAAPATAAGVPVDTTGAALDPNATDPNTGLTYAQEAGVQGQAYQYGYNPYNQGTGTPTPVATQQYADNGSWAQAAQDYLVNTAGADPATVADALGKYITGQPLTAAQQGVVSSAIAFVNYPPVAGVNGQPPGMNIAGSTGQPPPPPPPPPPTAKAVNPVGGLRVTDRGYTSVTLDWRAAKNAKSYLVTVDHGSTQVQREQVVSSVARIGNLKRGTKYDIRVWAQPGAASAHPAHITVTTK